MGAPAFNGNYDSSAVRMTIEPSVLEAAAAQVTSVSEQVAASANRINTALSSLRLSWTGQSAAQAQAYNDRWTTAMINIFGQNNDPGWGVLNRLAEAVQTAAANYAQTEGDLVSDYTTLLAQLSGTPGPMQQQGQNDTGLPISETY